MSMRKILLATRNAGKIIELKKGLQAEELELVSLLELGDVPPFFEGGEGYWGNATGKALFYHRHYQMLTLAEDSGLEVDYLKGKPGVFSARFGSTSQQRNQKLLKLMEDVPWEERGAAFICVMTVADGGKIIKVAEGRCRGIILTELKGEGGFGYDPLFYYPPLDKSFAELTTKEKTRVSHRGVALQKIKEFLRSRK